MEEKGEGVAWTQLKATRRVGGTGRSWVDLVEVSSETGTTPLARKTFLTTDSSREDQRLIDNEVTLLRSLEHPHVIRYVDSCRPDENHMSILMEFAPAGSLRDRLRDYGYLFEKDALCIMEQVARALEFVHALHIMHRDLKPDNILTFDALRVKLADFGVAKQLQHTLDGAGSSGVGTTDYMAPEMFDDDLQYGLAVDIWAFGVTLYELLAGERPWDAARRLKPAPRDVSEGCWAIILWCLDKDPSRRPAAADLTRAVCSLRQTGSRPKFVPGPNLWNRLFRGKTGDEKNGGVIDVARCKLVQYCEGSHVRVRVRLRDAQGGPVLAESVDVYELFVHLDGPKRAHCQWKLRGDELEIRVAALISTDSAHLTVTYRGIPLQESPLRITSKTTDWERDFQGITLMSFGSKGSNNTQFCGPYGVCVCGGQLFVSDCGNYRVGVCDLHGGFIRTFGSRGNGFAQLNHPTGIYVWNGEVYVCDCWNHRICVFGVDGTFLRQLGSTGEQDGQLVCPYGICVSGGEAFVVDDTARVQVFTLEGRWLRKWSFEGDRCEGSQSFKGVSVHGDLVFVFDSGTKQVLVFTLHGEFVSQWECLDPAGGVCAVDGGLWVTFTTGQLVLFDPKGHRLKRFDLAEGTVKLENLRGVCVVGDTVIVADSGRNRVQMIQ